MFAKIARVSILPLAVLLTFIAACGTEPATPTAMPATPTPTNTVTTTPSPTATATPTPSPTPVNPAALLEEANANTQAAASYRMVSNQTQTISAEGFSMEVIMEHDIVVQPPDALQGSFTMTTFGESMFAEMIWVDNVLYTRESDAASWVAEDMTLEESFQSVGLSSPLAAADMYTDVVFAGEEQLNETPVLHLQAKVETDQLIQSIMDQLGAELVPGMGDITTESDIEADFWISRDQHRLVKLTMAGETVVSMMESGQNIELSIVLQSETLFDQYDQPVSISAPQNVSQDVSDIITAVPATDSSQPSICVALDTGGPHDVSFNQFTLQGATDAAKELSLELLYTVAWDETDYEDNIEDLVAAGCDLIITVGFLMADATADAARANPGVHFAIVDVEYFDGTAGCPSSGDCYEDDLSNVTSLMFSEDEAGYLAGVLAGCVSQTGVVGSVSGFEIPPTIKFVTGFQSGARSQNPDIETLNVFIPDFNDPSTGEMAGNAMIADGADVIFGVGGNTGNGGLLAAHEAGVWAIGIDVDQYYTYPDVQSSLLTSAIKKIDAAVYSAVVLFADGQLEAGILLGTVANGGVGLAPYHDQEANISEACKEAVSAAEAGLAAGTIDSGYTP